MNPSFTRFKGKIDKLIPSGSAPTLSLSEANTGLSGLTAFLQEVINQTSLDLRQASLSATTQPQQIQLTGQGDLLGQQDLAITFSVSAKSDQGPLSVAIQFPWPAQQPLPYGNYQLEQAQVKLVWIGNDAKGKPLQYGLLSGTMKLGTINAPMQIRFPAAPDSIFIQSALAQPISLDQGLQQLVSIVPEAKELGTFLPQDVVKVISSLALDQVGILYNTKLKRVQGVNLAVVAKGWKLFNNFAIEDLRFSLMVGGIGSGTTSLTAELDADLVIDKSFRLPLFIRIGSNTLSIGKQSTERFQLPSFGAILAVVGEAALTNSLPDSFKNAAITIDTLEVDYDLAAKQLQSFYFAISIAGLQLEPNFELKFLGLGLKLDRQGTTFNTSGNFGCTLLLGKTNPVELDVSALLTDQGGSKSWQFNARAENINVGDLCDTLLEVFHADVKLPQQLHELVIAELGLSFSQATQGASSQSDYQFKLELKYPKNGQKADITLDILLSKTKPTPAAQSAPQQVQAPAQSGGYYALISGKIVIDQKEFDLDLSLKDESGIQSDLLVLQAKGVNIDLKSLADSLIADPEVEAFLPSVVITPKYALLGRVKETVGTTSKSADLLQFDLDLAISLKGLPLVGQLLGDKAFAIKDLQFTYATANIDEQEAQAINSLNPPALLTTQPLTGMGTDPAPTTTAAAKPVVLAQGLGFQASIVLGGLPPWQISLPAKRNTKATAKPTTPGSTAGGSAGSNPAPATGTQPTTQGKTTNPPGGDVTWLNLQHAVGPVQFNRIGFRYKDKMIWGYLDSSLSLAGLTILLDGLGVGNPIDRFAPTFTLNGLGLDYQQGPIEIGGTFLHTEVPADPAKNLPTYDEYDGMAVLKAEILNLSAIGSYARIGGHTSLFLYAVLNYPMGGPVFFFVTGLAAGFGYNRAVRMPKIEQVAQFPLVNEAVNGEGSAPPGDQEGRRNYLQQKLTNLRTSIYPKMGQYFLAAGIRFTSFEMLDSFVMVSVSFGQHFEVDILGLSTFAIPTPEAGQTVPPIAEAQLALRAVLNPDQGVLSVEALLTSNSYLFARACHLTGGFAFYAWFGGAHQGDFVITLGGYHPKFDVPKHYPQVPRLGFNWTLSDNFSIKGGLYFALTAHALMAGGNLQALFHLGPIKAWFMEGANFIVSWKPYFYDAHVYASIGVSFTFWLFGSQTVTFSLGADLHVWGPDFSGKATIHYYIVSFTISFGHADNKPRPIDWDTFKTSFLPTKEKVCTLQVSGGLLKQEAEAGTASKREIVNPKDLTILANTAIPLSSYQLHLKEGAAAGEQQQLYFADQAQTYALPLNDLTPGLNPQAPPSFGIAPMDVTKVAKSHLEVIITMTGEAKPVNARFSFTPIRKRMPRAMWGDKLQATTNGKQFITDALTGFEIRPAHLSKPGVTQRVVKSQLQYHQTTLTAAYACPQLSNYQLTGKSVTDFSATSQRKAQRDALLQGFGLDAQKMGLNPPQDLGDLFVQDPQEATFTQ